MILSTLIEHGIEPDLMDDTNPDDIYCGFVKSDADHCLIRRFTRETIDGRTVTRVRYPYGRFDWVYSWTDRATITDWRYRDFPPEPAPPPPPVVGSLRLTYDNIANVPVADASSVSNWNTFFDLPTNGGAFTSVVVTGNTVNLIGGIDITLKNYLFGDDSKGEHLLEIVDNISVINSGVGTFSDYGNNGYGCYNLTKIHLPNCTVLGDECFADCQSLTDLLLPFDDFTTLGDYVFSSVGLTEISFANVTSIGISCIQSCSALTTVNFPSLQTTGTKGFYNCDALTDVTFNSLTAVGNLFLAYCGGLTSVTAPELLTAANSLFSNSTGKFTTTLPKLTTVGTGAFEASNVTYASLPALTTMGDYAFSYSRELVTIDIPNVTQAYNNFCRSANKLLNVNLPLLASVGSYSLCDCTILQTIELPALTTVVTEFLSYCNSLTTVTIPALPIIGSYAFEGITGKVITLTVLTALMTSDGGFTPNSILQLQANNTVNLITV